MPKRLKLSQLNAKCRICLCSDGSMSDIFTEELRPKFNDLADCTSTQQLKDDDNYPRNICHICLYKLDMWIDFKKQFLHSNSMLAEHLEVQELSDNSVSVTKRKHIDICASPGDKEIKKKLKSDASASDHADSLVKNKLDRAVASNPVDSPAKNEVDEVASNPMDPPIKNKVEKAMASNSVDMSAKNNVEKASDSPVKKDLGTENSKTAKSEECPQKKMPDLISISEVKVYSETSSDVIPMVTSISAPVKTRQLLSRRGKTNERRKESTKRWVARKKALLAATGENMYTDSDSDSLISSDDPELSPVPKIRPKFTAKCIEAIEKNLAQVRKDPEQQANYDLSTRDESDVSIITESEGQKLSKTPMIKTEPKAPDDSSKPDDKTTPETSNLTSPTVTSPTTAEPAKMPNVVENFVPQSIRSVFDVDDATFIVTSTLILSEPHLVSSLNPKTPATIPKDVPEPIPDETTPDRNTDIIDAVQLRRVAPKKSITENDDKKIIESCLNIEVEGTELEALQRVQKVLANFVETEMRHKISSSGQANSKINKTEVKDSSSLDHQLKTIVEKAIKKNLENSKLDKLTNADLPNNRGQFTEKFMKAAERSKIFQPQVLLIRLDVSRTKPTKLANNSQTRVLGKRRTVQPVKYADYNVSPFNSESEELTENVKSPRAGPKSSKVKAYAPPLTKLEPVKAEPIRRISNNAAPPPAKKPMLLHSKTPSILQKSNVAVITSNSPKAQHICGGCGESFGTRKEVEIHYRTHAKQTKQKMMRCKRCQVTVEASLVKLHVCKSTNATFKCNVCKAAFVTDLLLARHMETHAGLRKVHGYANNTPDVGNSLIVLPKISIPRDERCVLATQNNQSYTCFVCDKTFTDEEILKDHLQKHCDDMTEDEHPSEDKEEYQCAICGQSLGSEEALEIHVEKHLFDDEDDNPNLISIGANDNDKKIRNEHVCAQCTETFDSEMLLMLHMQAHEEEVAIAEWERRGIDNTRVEQHICVICDDVFNTEAELSDHLDIHNGNPHICLLCDKPCLTLEELQEHVNSH